jgi:PKD repeat protein
MKKSTQYIIVGAVAFVVLLGALFIVSNTNTRDDGRQIASAITPTAEATVEATVVFRDGGEELPPPPDDKGGEVPPSGGDDAPPPPSGGDDAPPPPSGGDDAPPPPSGGNDAPPPPSGGNDAPPPPSDGNDAPPPPSGNDAPPPPSEPDDDGDGVPNAQDLCPSISGNSAEMPGCPPDTDGDGVYNDLCPTLGDVYGTGVDQFGCPNKVAIFEATINGLSVLFNGSGAGGEITGYAWDFGDGNSSAVPNPSHTYASAGNYTVTFTVTFSNGAKVVASENIEVSAPVALPGSSCAINTPTYTQSGNQFAVNFSASGDNIAGYQWDFGNGNIANGQTAQFTFTGAGKYDYTLTCFVDAGIAGQGGGDGVDYVLSGSVTVEASAQTSITIVAGFSTNRGSGEPGFTLVLTNTSTVTPDTTAVTYVWRVVGPNGYDRTLTTTERSQNASFVLDGGVGDYNITLTATAGDVSASATGKVQVVEQAAAPQISLNINPREGQSPLTATISLTNSGGPITSYNWSFGGGALVSGDTSTAGPFEVTFTGNGGDSFVVSVTVEGPGGGANVSQSVVILAERSAARASFDADVTPKGNNLFEVCFTNTTAGVYESATWDFGNGTVIDSMESVVCQEYAGGTYTVELAIRIPGGALSTSSRLIQVAEGIQPPKVTITASKTSVNVGETVKFTAQVTGAVGKYEWTFGELGSSTEESPSITFNAKGIFVVNLKVTGPGGTAEAAAIDITASYRQVSCSITNFSATPTFNQSVTYGVNLGNLDGRTPTYEWTFTTPDGVQTGSNTTFTAQYPKAGDYKIELKIFIDGQESCSVSRTAKLTLNQVTCEVKGRTTALLGSNTYEADKVNNLNGRTVTSREWTLTERGQASLPADTSTKFTYNFATPGTVYDLAMKLFISDGSFCERTITITVGASALACSISGDGSATQFGSKTYTANVSGGSGTITYSWTGPDGVTFSSTTAQRPSVYFGNSGTTPITVTIKRGSDECTVSRNIGVGGATLRCELDADVVNALLNQGTNFNVKLTNLGQRTATYKWYINEVGQESMSGNKTAYKWTVSGKQTVKVEVYLDGAESPACTVSKSIEVSATEVLCRLSAATSVIPFTQGFAEVDVTAYELAGFTFAWKVNGNAVVNNSNRLNFPEDVMTKPNSSFSIAYEVSIGDKVYCAEEKTIQVGADQFKCEIVAPGAIYNGETANFSVKVSGANGRDMSYAWFVDGQQVGTSQLLQTIYSGDGNNAEIKFVGQTVDGSGTCEVSVSVRVEASQSINAIATPDSGLVGLVSTFTAETVNIDRKTLRWFYPDGSSELAEVGRYRFTEAGRYTIRVTGVGPLRTQEASVVVVVSDESSLIASFVANPWQAVAPRTICFTDTSTTSRDGIISWEWTFQDGVPANSTEQNPCVNFTTTGDKTVTLRVNDGLLNGRAENKVTLFALVDQSADFDVEIKGDGLVCFSGNVSTGVTITGWNFGDGNTGGGTGEICHTYAQDGTYNVQMLISKDGTSGIVPRSIRVDSSLSTALPSLNRGLKCDANGTATFTVSNVGGPMTVSGTVSATVDGQPVTLADNTFQLGTAQTKQFIVSGLQGKLITFTTDANGGNMSASVECEKPQPELSASGVCVTNSGASFTITNNGGDMESDATATITLQSQTVATQSFRLAKGEKVTITADGFGVFSLATSGGGIGTVTASTENCKPALQLTSICWNNPTEHVFRVRNTSSVDVPFTWDVYNTDKSGSGTATPGDTTFVIPGVYGSSNTTRLFVSGILVQTKATNQQICEGSGAQIKVEGKCDVNGSVVFTASNVGKFPQTEAVSYTISNLDGALESGSFSLVSLDATRTFTFSNQKDQTVTFSSPGLTESVEVECPKTAPKLSVAGKCTAEGVATFTVSNNGDGAMKESKSVSIYAAGTGEDGADQDLVAEEGSTFQLGVGEKKTFTVRNVFNTTVYFMADDESLSEEVFCEAQTYRFSTKYQCVEGLAEFAITNEGDGNMLNSATVTITAEDGTDLTPDDNSFQLNAGETANFIGKATSFNQKVTIAISGGDTFVDVTALDGDTHCDPQKYTLNARAYCESGEGFVEISNNGAGDMLQEASVSLTKNGEAVSVSPNTFLLKAQEKVIFSVGTAWNSSFSISVSGGDSAIFDVSGLDTTHECDPQPYDISTKAQCVAGELVFVVTNDGPGDMVTEHTYTVSTTKGGESLDSGSYLLLAGQSKTITISNVYNAVAEFNANLGEGTSVNQVAAVYDFAECLPQPYTLSVAPACVAGEASFVVTNEGPGEMLLPHDVTIYSEGGEVLFSGGSFQLGAGEQSQAFSVANQWNKKVVFVSQMFGGGFETAMPAEGEFEGERLLSESDAFLPLNQVYYLESDVTCAPQPYTLSVSGVCNTGGVATFTVTNNGAGPMLAPQTFTITTSKNVNLTPSDNTFFLAGGESVAIEVANAYDSNVTFSSASNGINAQGLTSNVRMGETVKCSPPPTGFCYPSRVVSFQQGLTSKGNPVDPIRSNPAAALGKPDGDKLGTFFSLGFGGNIVLAFEGIVVDLPGADLQVFETTWPVNGQPPTASNYPERVEVFVAYGDGDFISIGTSFLDGTFDIAVSGLPYIDRIKLVDITNPADFGRAEVDGYDVDAVNALSKCGELPPTPVCTEAACAEPTPPPVTGICGDTLVMGTGANMSFPMINMSNEFCGGDAERPIPNWQPVVVGEGICVDWLVYHTNLTGDWEIFRLGDFPEGFGYNMDADVNLSKGYGERVFDLAPSRSPDAKYIAFASNRDGNWEIYVTPVDGTLEDQQRVTYNDKAIDLDPVWSPDGTKLAYESNVDGNWEIRLVDLLTGEKFRLTFDPANDINPFWGDDGKRLLFQSDREDGLWQIYELDVTDFNNPIVTRLTSTVAGVDFHDAQYSNDGTRIALRGESVGANGALQSIIYIMDLATKELTQVSTEGAFARNFSWSPDDTLIAYQSDADGDTPDIYVYEVATSKTRLLTDSQGDYVGKIHTAPTWICESTTVVFTSDVTGNNEIFSAPAYPIDGAPLKVDLEATQMTDHNANSRDPQNAPAEENASRNGLVPPKSR